MCPSQDDHLVCLIMMLNLSTRRFQEQYYIQAQATKRQNNRFFSVKMVKGDIISWMYETTLKDYIIKWENKIQYFERFTNILLMPIWNVRTPAYRPFINLGNDKLVDWFCRHLVNGFKFFQPHIPKKKKPERD